MHDRPSALQKTLPLGTGAAARVPTEHRVDAAHDTIRQPAPFTVLVPAQKPPSLQTVRGGAEAPRRERAASRPSPEVDGAGSVERRPPDGYRPFSEMGETADVAPHPRKRAQKNPLGRARIILSPEGRPVLRRDQGAVAQGAQPRLAKGRARFALLALGGALLVGFAIVLFGPQEPTCVATVRAGDSGGDVLDLRCGDLGEGSVARWRAPDGVVSEQRLLKGLASLALPTSLPLGNSNVTVELVRGQGGEARVETLPVRVAYRVRPDISDFSEGKPSFRLVVEAIPGSEMVVDGVAVPLTHGRGVHVVDVSRELSGPNNDASAQLVRRIGFEVIAPDGTRDRGLAAVAVAIVPLELDVAGRVVTDVPTFQLSGRTVAGARVHVGPHELPVDPSGKFAQSMSVSAIGTTEVEVRASQPGRAPRSIRLSVERTAALTGSAAPAKERR